ncbi:MAG: DUF6055 domain-containing protein [Nannocystales bacterium]
MFLLLTTALFAAEPCYGFSQPEQIEGEHVWVEYDENISQATAQAVVDEADAAWNDYVETFNWPAPPGPFSVIADFTDDSAFGRCITVECDGIDLPRCSVYEPAFTSGNHLNTTAHELGHAFQYGITGPFGVSLSAWAWWMEGTAEYMSYRLQPVQGTVSVVETYLGNPQWQLHHKFSEFIAGDRTGHLYGTAVLAMFIDEYYGGPDTVRETWEWGSMQGEDPIFFRDAIEGIGISFDTFWPDYMAHVSTVDLSIGAEVSQLPAHLDFDTLPGAATPPDVYFPEGLGITFFRVPKGLGQPDSDLVVRILGDESIRWQGALARVENAVPGASVEDYVGAQSGDDGVVELVLSDFDGSHDVMVALSPETISPEPFAFSIEAELTPTEVTADTDGSSSGEPPPVSETDDTATDPGQNSPPNGSEGCSVGGSRNTGAGFFALFGLAFAGVRQGRVSAR